MNNSSRTKTVVSLRKECSESSLGSNYTTHCKYYTNECDSQVVSVNRLVSAMADISCMAAMAI